MDTSAEYVAMCRQAKEIQELWKPDTADIIKGDFIGFITDKSGIEDAHHTLTDFRYSIQRFISDKDRFGNFAWYPKNELIWLPRQDQLHELIGFAKTLSGIGKLNMLMFMNRADFAYYRDYNNSGYERKNKFGTIEQFLLAYVMKTRWGKVWNGSDWVKEE